MNANPERSEPCIKKNCQFWDSSSGKNCSGRKKTHGQVSPRKCFKYKKTESVDNRSKKITRAIFDSQKKILGENNTVSYRGD